MSQYILRRVLLLVPMLIGITVVAFTFINVAPGDPVTAMIDPQQGSGGLDMDAVRESLGLNKPLPVRYAHLAQRSGQRQLRLLVPDRPGGHHAASASASPPTVELMGAALVFSTVVGCALGIGSALKRYSVLDYSLTLPEPDLGVGARLLLRPGRPVHLRAAS